MKRRMFLLFFLFFQGPFYFPSCLLAQNYIVSLKHGIIDWSNGVIEAVGIGVPPTNAVNLAQARAMAERAAVIAARENLIQIVKGVRIDSRALIRDFMANRETIGAEIQSILQNSQAVNISYMPGSVEATVAVELTGTFADMILPKSIRAFHPVQQPKTRVQASEEAYTGLVVDARGLRVKPAMAAKIVDEQGKEVYGSQYMSRGYAVQHGAVSYTKDFKAAEVNHRVANNPLIIKGIRSAGTGLSDIVISNADAMRIRGAASNLIFLHQCRVIIALD